MGPERRAGAVHGQCNVMCALGKWDARVIVICGITILPKYNLFYLAASKQPLMGIELVGPSIP